MQAYISAGIASEITTKLGAVPEITLIEKMQLKKALEEQSFQSAGYVDPKTAVNIGKTLGAKVIVVGEYQKIGNQLKITARFVDVETAEVIKGKTAEVAGSYDPDVFKLENEIAFQIVKALGGATDVAKETEVKKEIESKVTTSSISAFEWFGKCEEAYNANLYDKAIEYCTKAIEIDGNYADAYFIRGDACVWKNLYDEAIKDCTRAIELAPQDAMAYMTCRNAYDFKGLFDKAIKYITKLIELFPKNALMYYSRGFDYSLNGQYDEAIKDYTRAIEIDPNYTDAYSYRGISYGRKGLFDDAIKDLTRAIELDPKDADAYLYRGTYFIGFKHFFDEGIKDCTKVIELDPKNADANFCRGSAYAWKNSYDDAIKNFTRAIELNPKDAVTYIERGKAYANKGKQDDAIRDYSKAIELDPKNTSAYTNRGVSYYKKGLKVEIKTTDYVIVPYGQFIFFGIISGCNVYDKSKANDELGYCHQRPVKWLYNKKAILRNLLTDRVFDSLKGRLTVITTYHEDIEDIVRNKKHFFTQQPNFDLKVEKEKA